MNYFSQILCRLTLHSHYYDFVMFHSNFDFIQDTKTEIPDRGSCERGRNDTEETLLLDPETFDT